MSDFKIGLKATSTSLCLFLCVSYHWRNKR